MVIKDLLLPKRPVWIVCLHYLRSSKRKYLPSTVTFLSFLSVSISIATLIIVTSVFNGFETTLTEKVIGLGSHVTIYQKFKGEPLDDSVVAVAKKHPEVVAAYVSLEGQGMVMNKENGASSGFLVNGLTEEGFAQKGAHFENMNGCNLDDFDKTPDQIFLSSALVDKLGARLGSKVSVIMPNIKQTIFGPIPKTRTYTLGCIFRIGMYQYDEIYSFLPIKDAESLVGDSSHSKMISVVLRDPMVAAKVAKDINKALPEGRFLVTNWKDDNVSMIEALNIERSVMMTILSLFVCMATFAIFSNVLLMVKEKQKSIAVLQSMGLGSWQVWQIFFLTGVVIGVCGIIFGTISGVGIAMNIQPLRLFVEKMFGLDLFNPAVYFLSNLPSDVRLSNVLWVAVGSFVATVVASVVPARKAAKCSPASVLRDY